jgi:isopentenyl-diphosphate delta-isomerase
MYVCKGKESMNQTEERKREHVQIALDEDVAFHYNYWDDVKLIHNALPEINLHDVSLSKRLFGKKLGAPIIISGMTGGYNDAKKINENLAAAAAEHQVGMGVGSQRAALEDDRLKETYSVIKDYDIPLKIANIGASQMVLWGKDKILDCARVIVDMINADILAICLNFLQEAVQPEGEAHAKGCYDIIKTLAEEIDTPIIVKESGAGISRRVAELLVKTRIKGIDVGGAGGTSFAAVEYYRAQMRNDEVNMRLGRTFWDWGIPTPLSVIQVKEATKGVIPVIATGGVRNGLDVARAIAIGADAAGVAHALLKPATQSRQSVQLELDMILKELQTAMFLVGADNVDKLSKAEVRYADRIRD